MKSRGYIYVVNWDTYQHYRDRRPAWIKLHLDLLHHDEWLSLCPEDRVLLMTIWMLTAQNGGSGRVVADQKWLCRQAEIGWSPRSRNLERLVQAGFIKIRASKALAGRSKNASPEGSKEPKRKNARERLAADTAAAARVEENPPTQNGWTGASEARAEFLRLAAQKHATQ